MRALFSVVRPAGRSDWLVKVQCTRGKGKCQLNSKDVGRGSRLKG